MIQIQFTHFPGYEPHTTVRGWRHLPTPFRKLHDDDVYNLNDIDPDPFMELIDWAIDNHPAAFGLDWSDGDYEPANILAVSLAGELALTAEHVAADRDCIPGDGGGWSNRYRDITLSDGVIARVAHFH